MYKKACCTCEVVVLLIKPTTVLCCVFFPFLLTSPLSLLKLFTVTMGCLLHHIVLGLNVSSVRSFTQMEGVFFYILFFKVTLFKVVELAERKEENKTKQNQPTNKKQSNTQTRTLLSMNRTWL